ncbi:unnamed protein product [Somion occarium]|uniref:ATP synthase F0 subunit 8 n=1 Tax=Somion occarium TaxID=3059160 RepID=A0ABP1DSI4_9APHY
MSELLSLSVIQLLSIFSFFTSVFAVLRVGSGSFHRLSHKFESDVARPAADLNVGTAKWSWSGLPVSFSLNTILGEDETKERSHEALGGYTGGGQLVRMNWQTTKQHVPPSIYYQQTPISMAKLIMSRHSQRKPYRIPRRTPGMPRPTPPSRLMESAV